MTELNDIDDIMTDLFFFLEQGDEHIDGEVLSRLNQAHALLSALIASKEREARIKEAKHIRKLGKADGVDNYVRQSIIKERIATLKAEDK